MTDEEGLDLLHKQMEFSGCKIALLCDDKLLTILRDDISTIPWPNMWELPGGGREGEETPFECVQREVFEELGLKLKEVDIFWVKDYPGMLDPEKPLFLWWEPSLRKNLPASSLVMRDRLIR